MAVSARKLDPNQAQVLANLFLDLSHSDKTRRVIAKAVKEVDPDGHGKAFTDIDMQDQMDTFKAQEEERRLKEEGERRVTAQAKQKQKLIDDGKYKPEQVTEIEAVMARYGIADYEAGAVLYAHEHPPENPKPGDLPATRHGATYEFPTIPGMSFADFAKDPTKAARNGAYADIEKSMRSRR